jgi:deoxyribose-phosphate aldolase
MRVEELAKTLDHSVLSPRATREDVERACGDARELHLAAVCSLPTFVPLVSERLRGTDVKTCSVVSFPYGADLPGAKAASAEEVVSAGADEIDVVMNLPALLSGDFRLVRDDLVRVVAAARSRALNSGRGHVIVKVIIEAPLLDDRLTRLACRIVAESGADFAKTATGVGTRATVEDVELMRESLPGDVGVKAAGGIRTLAETEAMVEAGAARVGTSAAPAIVRELMAAGGAR